MKEDYYYVACSCCWIAFALCYGRTSGILWIELSADEYGTITGRHRMRFVRRSSFDRRSTAPSFCRVQTCKYDKVRRGMKNEVTVRRCDGWCDSLVRCEKEMSDIG